MTTDTPTTPHDVLRRIADAASTWPLSAIELRTAREILVDHPDPQLLEAANRLLEDWRLYQASEERFEATYRKVVKVVARTLRETLRNAL